MDKQIKLLKELKETKKRFMKLEKTLTNDLKELPTGYLLKRKDGRLMRVVDENGKKRQIRLHGDDSKDKKMIRDLKYKRYIKEALPILETWLKHLTSFLKGISVYDPIAIEGKLKEQYKGLADLPIFLEGDINPQAWARKEYPKMYEEGLVYLSEAGLKTRSKSEAQIASKYESKEWEFEYEPIVPLKDGRVLRPDFVILHPIKRKLIYHEHFGLMDNSEYAIKALKKIQDYASIGICLNDNLVITYETKQQPLTYQEINELIKKIEAL